MVIKDTRKLSFHNSTNNSNSTYMIAQTGNFLYKGGGGGKGVKFNSKFWLIQV